MSIKLKVASTANGHEVSAQVELPTRGMTFTMTPLGARQLAAHLMKLADAMDEVASA